MNPTKAQREAAARAMFELEYKLMGSDWVIPEWDESYRSYWEPLASAALKAAMNNGQDLLLKEAEIERLWIGVNQAMTLLAQDGLLDTKGYRRLQDMLKKDDHKGIENDTTIHHSWLDSGPDSGPY